MAAADSSEGVVHVPASTGGVAGPDERTVEEYRKEAEAEWGTYKAKGPIDIGGVRAFNVGEAVPKSHVDSGVVAEDMVEKASTKAGQALQQR